MKFSIGSDPEAFFVNDDSNQVVNAGRFTDGTKDSPEDVGGGFFIMNDNILIEGNVPPSYSKEEFVANMSILHEMMNKRASSRGAHIVNEDVMTISDALSKTKEGLEFGCSSFLDAWNGSIEIQTPILVTNDRTAGCHIHIGFDNKDVLFKAAVVKCFDMFVTLPRIKRVGANFRSSNMYGLLGAMRLTSYGVEARSLGGKWFRPDHMESIYDDTAFAVDFAEKNFDRIKDLPALTSYKFNDRVSHITAVRDYLSK